jgi:hypothetical protein
MVKNKRTKNLNKSFFFRKNKRGWIKIVEAFLAILLLITIILLAVNTRYLNVDKEEGYFNVEGNIFKKVQINDTLRNSVLNSTIPVNSSDENFPSDLETMIEDTTPIGIDCSMAICPTNSTCDTGVEIEKSTYVKEILIVGNSTTYSPRIVKLTCY